VDAPARLDAPASFAVTSPTPLEAPVITMTCLAIGRSFSSMVDSFLSSGEGKRYRQKR
jgi:hypothetical protein